MCDLSFETTENVRYTWITYMLMAFLYEILMNTALSVYHIFRSCIGKKS